MNDKSISLEQVSSSVALFKMIPISYFRRCPNMIGLTDCIRHGFLFITDGGAIIDRVPQDLYDIAAEHYGLDALKFNSTFWKSFNTVKQMSPDEYLYHQVCHYFSTYGAEQFGYNCETYVPAQAFDLPDEVIQSKNIVLIRACENYKIEEAITEFLRTVAAPNPLHRLYAAKLFPLATIKTEDIRSFEFQCIKHRMDGTVPEDPVTFLRYLVYSCTGETVLIKNQALRNAIRGSSIANTGVVATLLGKADLTKLASIFLRYRPIFLAFKSHKGCAPIINKLRRMADKYHRPMSDVSVKNVTSLILQERMEDVYDVLARATNRELIKIGNAIGCRMMDFNKSVPGVYSIRNGRTFVRNNVPALTDKKNYRNLYAILQDISTTLHKRLSESLKGRTFVLPDGMEYAVPVTEKQVTGVIPWGTVIDIPTNGAITAGIHWTNQKEQRVDIDLHMNSATEHFGWNGDYTGNHVTYSGDQTDAPKPNGAAEAFHFLPCDDPYILDVNLYNGPDGTDFEFLLSTQSVPDTWDRGFIFDPSEVVMPPVPMKFTSGIHQMTLGMITKKGFFVYGGTLSDNIIPTANYGDFISGIYSRLQSHWLVSELLETCGANTITEAEYAEMEDKSEVVSLLPADLTPTTLFRLVDGTLFEDQK